MQSKWIWFRGDYEFYHGLKLHMRRKEFGCDYPAFWNQPNVYPTVTFMKTFHTDKEGYVKILACGKGYVMFDNTYRFNVGEDIFFGDGDHTVVVRICNPSGLPCIYAISDTFCTDRNWLVSPNTEDYINAGDTP